MTEWLAVVERMIITQLIIVSLMVLATKTDGHAVFEEYVYIFLSLIEP